jgi:tetratricopeptide (TPR) repeat protein
MLGDHASMAGDWTQAQSDYRRYLEIRPGNPRVEEHLADALYRAGAGPEAIDAYRRVIELDDTAVRARNNLAQLLREVGRLDEALETAQAAYARAPEEVIVLDTLGWLFVAHGLPRRAVALLRKAHEGAPDSAEIQYHLAVAYREAGQMDEARSQLEALRAVITPNDLLTVDVDAALESVR